MTFVVFFSFPKGPPGECVNTHLVVFHPDLLQGVEVVRNLPGQEQSDGEDKKLLSFPRAMLGQSMTNHLVNTLTPSSYMNSSKPSLVSIWKLPSIFSGTAIFSLVVFLRPSGGLCHRRQQS